MAINLGARDSDPARSYNSTPGDSNGHPWLSQTESLSLSSSGGEGRGEETVGPRTHRS
jgi:hypothetical protein